MRQQEDALGAEPFRFLRIADGERRSAAGSRDDRHAATTGVHRRADDSREFLRLEGEEFAGAAGGEERCGAVGHQPLQAFRIGSRREPEVLVEVRQRERQEARRDDALEFLRRGHGRFHQWLPSQVALPVKALW
jgi:hypothetical protein